MALEGSPSGGYKAYMKHSKKGTRLNLLPLDYQVQIASANKVVQFNAAVDGDVEYTVFMALEVDSQF